MTLVPLAPFHCHWTFLKICNFSKFAFLGQFGNILSHVGVIFGHFTDISDEFIFLYPNFQTFLKKMSHFDEFPGEFTFTSLKNILS